MGRVKNLGVSLLLIRSLQFHSDGCSVISSVYPIVLLSFIMRRLENKWQ